MYLVFIILLLFNPKTYAAEINTVTTKEKMTVTENSTDLINSAIYILYFKKKRIEKILFKESTIIGIQAQGLTFDDFKASNTIFKGAKLAGATFKKCHLENVKFIDSDLSFSNFKKCKSENVTLINTIDYEISSF